MHGEGDQVIEVEPDLGLTPLQHKVLELMTTETSLQRVAEKAGVSERTIRRWLKDPFFSGAFEDSKRARFQFASSLFQRLASTAVGEVVRILNDPAAPPAAKLGAVRLVFKISDETLQRDDFARRLELLEQRMRSQHREE